MSIAMYANLLICYGLTRLATDHLCKGRQFVVYGNMILLATLTNITFFKQYSNFWPSGFGLTYQPTVGIQLNKTVKKSSNGQHCSLTVYMALF